MEEGEMISAEEFFGEAKEDFGNAHRAFAGSSLKRGERLFEETKIRMVMKIHKISRTRAKAMIEEIKARCAKVAAETANRDGNCN